MSNNRGMIQAVLLVRLAKTNKEGDTSRDWSSLVTTCL